MKGSGERVRKRGQKRGKGRGKKSEAGEVRRGGEGKEREGGGRLRHDFWGDGRPECCCRKGMIKAPDSIRLDSIGQSGRVGVSAMISVVSVPAD